MKRGLLALLAVALLLAALPVLADDTIYTEGTLYYTVGNESITIVGCFGKNKEITVPAMIAGYPVNKIAKGAFVGNHYLQQLNLPDTIMIIEDEAIAEGIAVLYNWNTDYPSWVRPEIINRPLSTAIPVVTEAPPSELPGDPTPTPTEAPTPTPTAKPAAPRTQKATSAPAVTSIPEETTVIPDADGDAVHEGEELLLDDDSVTTEEPTKAPTEAPTEEPTAEPTDMAVNETAEPTEEVTVTAAPETAKTGNAGVPVMVWIAVGAVIVLGCGIAAFFALRKRQ